MARLDGVSDQDAKLATRQIFGVSRRQMGEVPEPLRLFAHCPPALFAVGGFQLMFERASSVDPVLKALCQLKVASMIGCVFCLDVRSAMGREHGVTEAQITDLAIYPDSDAFSTLQRTVLDYAVSLTETPDSATDDLVADLRKSFDDRQLVELTTSIAWENFRARFNRGFNVAAQGFSEGSSCPTPECAAQRKPTPVS